jgi:hypothetical protein
MLQINITGIEELQKQIAKLQVGIPVAMDLAMKESLILMEEIGRANLQSDVYDRTEGPYAGRTRGDFFPEGELSYDLLDAFRMVVSPIGKATLGQLLHTSIAGQYLEYGTSEHLIGPANVPEMKYIDPHTGEEVETADTYEIAGIIASYWFSNIVSEAYPLIIKKYRMHLLVALRIALR